MEYMRLTADLRNNPQVAYIGYCLSQNFIPDLPEIAFLNL